MEAPKVDLARTELDFLHRLLLELQKRLAQPDSATPGGDDEKIAALELALAMLHWDGATPPGFDQQLGLGAAVELKLGADAMCAYRQWRTERRKRTAGVSVTP
ncbi:hypothetical protein WG902_11635 [Ramlibacter sp. PS3R-8]|uniref:hypothetical protein n=1 Tax=Ramlibacter sp. PS3R-8 TaxID=3133437 RepID=UPI003099D857